MLKVLLTTLTLSIFLIGCSSLEKSEKDSKPKKTQIELYRTYLEK